MRRGTMVTKAEMARVEGAGKEIAPFVDGGQAALLELALRVPCRLPTLPEAKRREPDSVLPGSRNQGTCPPPPPLLPVLYAVGASLLMN